MLTISNLKRKVVSLHQSLDASKGVPDCRVREQSKEFAELSSRWFRFRYGHSEGM